MTIEKKVTERDKKLLIFLAAFLIVVGCILLIVKPGLKQAGDLREEIATSRISKEEMDDKILSIPALEMQLDAKSKEWENINTMFYPIMESRDIDRIVTNEVLACEVNSRSLQIAINTHKASNVVDFQTAILKDDTTGEKELVSELYTASINLVVEGSEANVRTLTDRFVNDYDAVRVVSMTYSTEDNIFVEMNRDKTVLNIELEFYMFEKGEN